MQFNILYRKIKKYFSILQITTIDKTALTISTVKTLNRLVTGACEGKVSRLLTLLVLLNRSAKLFQIYIYATRENLAGASCSLFNFQLCF